MIARIIGALARAFLVVLFVTTPSLLLPTITQDSAEAVALVAIFAAVFTLVEYGSRYPSMVEFRFAAPFNRLRFAGLFVTVFLLSLIFRGMSQPDNLTEFVTLVGRLVGYVIDLPYSPVRLVMESFVPVVDNDALEVIRAAVGLSYVTALLMLAIFIVALHLNRWPSESHAFNVWVNMPLFEPTLGVDIVARLNRDAIINVVLGICLPFILPVVTRYGTGYFDPREIVSPQPLIWMVAFWAFLPASLIMRGIAMKRVATMIATLRQERADLAAQHGGDWQTI